jgi:hypothetical protein
MLLITDERMLAAISCIEPTHADGILGVVDLGDAFLTCYYRKRPIKFEGGQVVYERDPVVNLLRPRSALVPGSLIERMLTRQMALN